MLLDDASLYEKLVELQKTNAKPVVWNYTANFIIGDDIVPIINVVAVHRISDYIKTYSDQIFATIHVTNAIYTKVLLPNKDKLLVKLNKELMGNLGPTAQINQNYSQIFSAFLTESGSPHVASNDRNIDKTNITEMSDLKELVIHIADRELYELRLYEMAGIWRSVTVTELLTGLMSQPIKSNGNIPINVAMVEADNKKRYFQLPIPHGVRLVDLPNYVQKYYGVYSSGVGSYLTQGYWFIYPLLNHQRFSSTNKTLTILNIPANEMYANDKSYLIYDDSVVVFSTGDSIHTDNSERVLNNLGRGFRYSIATNIIDNYRVVDDQGPYIPKGRNHVVINTEKSPTKMENIRAVPGLFTDNPWEAVSQMTAGLASLLGVQWLYANIELLYPGMPVKIIYKHKSIVQALYGTLIHVESHTATEMQSPTDKRYITNASLMIHCERVINENTPSIQ